MIQIAEKPSPGLIVVTALRHADLNGDELAAVAEALDQAPPDVSPRALAERVRLSRSS